MKKHLINGLAALGVAAMFSAPGSVSAQPGPNLYVTIGCALAPNVGPQAVSCHFDVGNGGTVPSAAPVTVTLTPSMSAGSTYQGGSGTFPCSTPVGSMPASIACGSNLSLAPTQNGTTHLNFNVPQGGSFSLCATATQGSNAATLPDPNPTNNTNVCTKIMVPPPPSGGKFSVTKEVVNPYPAIATPGPFFVDVQCKPSGEFQLTLGGSNLSQVLSIPPGAQCQITEKSPKPPEGCKWVVSYPNGQMAKDGSKLVVRNELQCGATPATCPPGQGEVTFPGAPGVYCCDGKPGNDKFCCKRVK